MTPEKTPAQTTVKKSIATAPKSTVRARAQTQNSPTISPIRSKSRLGEATIRGKPSGTNSRQGSPALGPQKEEDLTLVKPFVRSKSHHEPGTIPFRQRQGIEKPTAGDDEALDLGEDENFTMVIPSLARPVPHPAQRSPPKPTHSPGRLGVGSPRTSPLKSPKSMGNINGTPLSATRSPRMRSPDRPSTRGTDAGEEVQVYEDPFVGEETTAGAQSDDKPVLEELAINEKNIERRQSTDSVESMTMMGDGQDEQSRGHHKTTSTGSVIRADNNDANRPEVLKNRQLLISGINKIRSGTVEAHMFRRLQDMVKSNQDIWGQDDEKFDDLLLASLEYLETPSEFLKAPSTKIPDLKVRALATVRAMLSLYRKETAKFFPRVLITLLRTKAQYENSSHMASDLENTADELVKYGQTSECINAVLSTIEDSPAGSPTASPNSKASVDSNMTASNRTTTMALSTLAELIQITAAKSVQLTPEQVTRLGRLAVRCLDDTDPDVRKADIDFCLALEKRIGGDTPEFWKAVAGAREQHLSLITYYMARRNKSQ